jgi:hypothetical protein
MSKPPAVGGSLAAPNGEARQWFPKLWHKMKLFPKLWDERLSVLEEDFMVLRGVSPTEAHAWFELRAKEIAAMALFLDDDGLVVIRLDEIRWRLTAPDLREAGPPVPESI